MDTDQDRILAIVLQDIINNEPDFEPIGGDLTVYQGEVGVTKNGTPIKIRIELGYRFPYEPPTIKAITPIQHPIVNFDQKISTPSLNNWNSNYTISRIIREIREEFKKNPPVDEKSSSHSIQSPPVAPPMSRHELLEIDMLKTKINTLQAELHHLENLVQKEKEKILQNRASKSTPISPKDELIAEKKAIQKLLKMFEEYYEDALISPSDFYRFYRIYIKELFILNSKLSINNYNDEVKQNVSKRTSERRLA